MYRFRDFYTLNSAPAGEGQPLPFLFSDALNLLEDVQGTEQTPILLVTIDATYSGYLLNHRCYPGKFMSDHRSWGTWTSKDHGGSSPYDKPILTHHQQDAGDPIGRVVGAAFQRLWADDLRFNDDYKSPATQYDEGSGKIVIQAAISDPDAQAKIVDGRYKTFSSGQSSEDAWCSVCKHNIGKTQKRCEHYPGDRYEVEVEGSDDTQTVTMYLITGYLDYHEGSFVNIPGNSFAQVTNIQQFVQEVEDSLEVPHSESFGHLEVPRYAGVAIMDQDGNKTELIRPKGADDKIPYGKGNVRRPVAVSLVDLDLAATSTEKREVQEGSMDYERFAEANVARSMFYSGEVADDGQSAKVSDRIMYGAFTNFRTITDDADGHRHVLDLEVNLQSGKVRGYTSLTSDESPEHYHLVEFDIDDLNSLKKGVKGKTGEPVDEMEGKHSHGFKVAFGATHRKDSAEFLSLEEILDRIGTLEASIKQGELTEVQARRLVPFGDDLEILEASGCDAKLTAAARKKLGSKTFCGPGRSFPVNDCAHVTAARRLIGRFKGSAKTKAGILACVNRKAKSMGCDKGKDAATGGIYASFSNQKVKTMSKEIEKKKPDAEDTPAPGDQDTELTLEDLKRISKQQSKELEQLNDRVSDLQSKADSANSQLDERTKELADMRTDLRNTLAQQLVWARLITKHADTGGVDSQDKFQELVDSYAERTIESLQDSVKDSFPAVNSAMARLTDKGSDFLVTKPKDEEDETLPAKHEDKTNTPQGKPVEKEIETAPTDADLDKI